jgi:Ca2+-binding RTX toxin-like protein
MRRTRRTVTSALAALAVALPLAALATHPAAAQQKQRTPTCHGRRATIVGNNHRNQINGTRHRDVIAAGGGNDIIIGNGGNDLICAGAGNDIIDGGTGNDLAFGQTGRDLCFGTAYEHSHLHFGCEVHNTAPPPVGGPPPSNARAAARQLPKANTAARKQLGEYVLQSSNYTQCAPRRVVVGTLEVSGENTTPGSLVGIREVFVPYSLTSGRYDLNNAARSDWRTYIVPTDGQVHTIPPDDLTLTGADAWEVFAFAVWSKNGADWSAYDVRYTPLTNLFLTRSQAFANMCFTN